MKCSSLRKAIQPSGYKHGLPNILRPWGVVPVDKAAKVSTTSPGWLKRWHLIMAALRGQFKQSRLGCWQAIFLFLEKEPLIARLRRTTWSGVRKCSRFQPPSWQYSPQKNGPFRDKALQLFNMSLWRCKKMHRVMTRFWYEVPAFNRGKLKRSGWRMMTEYQSR